MARGKSDIGRQGARICCWRVVHRAIGPFAVLAVALLLVTAACGSATPEPTADPGPRGTVRGTVVYEDLANEGGVEPMGGVRIVLCRVPAEGVPEGPVVAPGAGGDGEEICALQAVPTGLSGPDGAFTVDPGPAGPPVHFMAQWHPIVAYLMLSCEVRHAHSHCPMDRSPAMDSRGVGPRVDRAGGHLQERPG